MGVGLEQVFRLVLEVVGATRQFLDEREGLPPLVAHQADGALVHDPVQHQEVLVLVLLLAHEVVGEVGLELGPLLVDVAEVDEEPGAHVPLEVLDLVRLGGFVVPDQKVAVLEEAAAADLFGVPRGDELLVQVVEGLLETAQERIFRTFSFTRTVWFNKQKIMKAKCQKLGVTRLYN